MKKSSPCTLSCQGLGGATPPLVNMKNTNSDLKYYILSNIQFID
jgi:hypothetical protein